MQTLKIFLAIKMLLRNKGIQTERTLFMIKISNLKFLIKNKIKNNLEYHNIVSYNNIIKYTIQYYNNIAYYNDMVKRSGVFNRME